MKVWVCRADKNSYCIEDFVAEEKIYCTWQGFPTSWEGLKREEMRSMVSRNKGIRIESHSIGNLVSQIDIFANRMAIGDLVLVPNTPKQTFLVGRLVSEYEFCTEAIDEKKHSRSVSWITSVRKMEFSQEFLYTLGAFRTVFEVRKEEQIKEVLAKI